MPKHNIAGAAALLLATAPAAWAEIDAKTIWADWQDMAGRFGGTLTAESEEYAGGALTLTDVAMVSNFGAGDSTMTYGTVTFVELEDGTVRIELPATMSSTGTTEVDGETLEQSFDIVNDGLEIVAREDDGVRTYDANAKSLIMMVQTQASADADPVDVTLSLFESALILRSGVDGDPDAFAQSMTADTLIIAMADDTEGETVVLNYGLSGITSELAGTYGEAREGPVESFADFAMTYGGDVSHSGGVLNVTGEGPQGPFSVNSTSESGKLELDVTEESLGYTIGSTGTAATVDVPGFPVPIQVSMAESTVGFVLPFGETDVEKPFAIAIAARELVLDDAIWGMFDPTGQLPRDPATLVIDMDGSVVMNVDMFGDPAAMARMEGAPGDLKTLAINQILLTFAGAELRGSGALEFPEVTTVPEPVGTIELALDGGFALVDKLVALGFVPAEQAAFVKGMAGAVTRPVGDDQLESTIEFTPGGGISANGLPLK